MKVNIVFLDWQDRNGNSIYSTSEGIMLSRTCFHSGSTFEAEISFDVEDAEFLREVLEGGEHTPVFYVTASRENKQ